MAAYSLWFALPDACKKGDIPKDLPALAKHFGVSVKSIEEAKRRPEVATAVLEKLRHSATFALPNILWTMIAKAEDAADKECIKAARFVGEFTGAIKAGGSVNVNNTVVTPVAGDWTDQELRSKVFEIAKRAVPPDIET